MPSRNPRGWKLAGLMTVRKRLFWSNILMILVPAGITALVGLVCLGCVLLTLMYGTGLGIRSREDFDRVSPLITEAVEKLLESGGSLSRLDGILGSNGMGLTVIEGSTVLYAYGADQAEDPAPLEAAQSLGNGAQVSVGQRSVLLQEKRLDGQVYQICLFGSNAAVQSAKPMKIALALCALAIALAILFSILLTNRFLTKFVFRRIEEPLEILTQGVHQLRDGNLDFQINYDRQDEFAPICQDFNEMARRLKASVQQLQNEERSRKVLIAGISHDIRSPLTSIQAYVEGLLDGVAQTPEAQHRYLTTIKNKAEDLEHIVSQLFLFSKLELGEASGDRQPMRLDTCIADTVSGLQEEYRQKGLDVALHLAPVTIAADPVLVQCIVMNILENSLKYKRKPRGKLDIQLDDKGEQAVLCFADDGPGVPAEALPHLFEVFYRSDPARKNPGSGSGLGLAIVAGATEKCGGTIQAWSGA